MPRIVLGMTQTPVPTEFLNFLGRKYAGRTLTEQELSIVEETWAMATVVPKRRALSIEEIATSCIKRGSDPLLDRLILVSGVIRGTLDKLTGVVPPELKWAASARNLRIVGISRPGGYGGIPRDISAELRSGKLIIENTDFVLVTTGQTTAAPVYIPLDTLSNNPTAIAQSTRAAFKAHAEKRRGEAYVKSKDERSALKIRIAGLQNELVELNEKIAAQAVEDQAQYDATMARAKVQAEERAAASAARRAEQQDAE